MPKTTYLENQLMNWIKGSGFASAPANVYLSLWNGSPTITGTSGTEVTTTVRVAGRMACAFGSITAGVMANSALIDFGNAAGAATISHFGIHDSQSGGTMLGFSPLTGGSQAIAQGTDVQFAIGSITWTES